MHYPAKFKPHAAGGFVVTFRDIPEAITQGDDEADVISMAEDALATALEFYFEDRRPVPPPSDMLEGERAIALPDELTLRLVRLNGELLTEACVRLDANYKALATAAAPVATWWIMVEAQEELAEKPIPDHAVILHFMGSGASTMVTARQLRDMVQAMQKDTHHGEFPA
jgi:antitoxin HicB